MSHLLEYRKIDDSYLPLYFKFGTISTKCNLTSDKYMSLENWMHVFDQLDEIITGGSSSSRKSKSFDLDKGRLTVKVKWAKTSDFNDIGSNIVKILNLPLSNVGKYFLKIDVKLNSNFERLITELEKKNKVLEEAIKIKQPSQEETTPAIIKKCDDGEDSTMLPEMHKEKPKSPLPSKSFSYSDPLEDLNLEGNSVEEYIPHPVPIPSNTSSFTSPPIYCPENNSAQIAMNQMQSQYSPEYVNNQQPDKPTKELMTYKPSTRKHRSSDRDETKRSHSKKSRIRGRSKELFGTSDEDDDEAEKVSSSSQHKSKRKKETSSPKRDSKSNKETTKSKKRVSNTRSSLDSNTGVGDISLRNLMDESIEDILATFPQHADYLTEMYRNLIGELKRNYKPRDLPDLIVYDIVTNDQFKAMVEFLEKKLVKNLEMEHNSSDVIFDALLPEWAMAIFCKKFELSRSEALQRLHTQTAALNNRSDSELFKF